MKRLITLYGFLVLFIGLPAQKGLETNRLSVFTDGNSFVEKTGIVSVENKEFVLRGEKLPVPRFGTLFITSKDNSFSYISSRNNVKTERTIDVNVYAILRQNIGNSIDLQTSREIYSGKLLEVMPRHVMIKSDTEVIISFDDILTYRFPDKFEFDKNKTELVEDVKSHDAYGRLINDINNKSELILHFDDSGIKHLTLSYLQKGISWNPVYRLVLGDDKTARLSLQAELINDSESLSNTTVDFIVGSPQFLYHEFLMDLIDYNNKLDPYYESDKNKNSHYAGSSGMLNEIAVVAYADNQEQERFHDFQVHTINNVNLGKNARALYDIYEHEVAYEHIYECNLDSKNDNGNFYNWEKHNDTDAVVYHSILIDNTTSTLIGEGPVLIFDDKHSSQIPLSQSKMNFVPASSKGTVKLSENNEIQISNTEIIIGQEDEETYYWDRGYYKSFIEGSIRIANYNSQAIELHINSEINGVLDNSPKEYELISQRHPFNSPNYLSQVKWIVSLEPGESKVIKYNYEFYID